MAVGIMSSGDLMVRVGPDGTDEALAKPHTRLFEMRGRSMTGWVIVDVDAVKTKRQLGPWVKRGVAFASSLPPK
jgi:TfoX N-terminal domain